MSIFSSLFGGTKTQATQQAAAAGLNVQTSVQGKPVPIIYGATRVATNLIWYGDFQAVQKQSQSGGGGGKGGVGGGGGGKGGGGSSGYLYYASFIGSLCEGPITGIGTVWVDKNLNSLAGLGMGDFLGTQGQAPWGFMTTNHPAQALGYSGFAYIVAANYSLGNSPQLPNHNFEVYGLLYGSTGVPNVPDADPSQVLVDLISNPLHGAGFPSARIGSLATWQAYAIASGLWVSPAYSAQTQTSQLIDDLCLATNSALVWSQGLLTVVPYGDQSFTSNGFTYTAPSAPVYSLGDDDFLNNGQNTGSSTSQVKDPVVLTRKRKSDALNTVKVEYLDRNNSYNTSIVEVKDSASINIYGLRPGNVSALHMFCDGNAAMMSATLQLQRQSILNNYSFTVDQRYIGLDPMDIVAVTDANLGMSAHWVRILSITENNDLSLSITAEDYLNGTGSAPLYSFQRGFGFEANYNVSPGTPTTPVIFEPTEELGGGLEVWMAVSGGSQWGGADVYISTDGTSYKIAGRITGNSRTGVLTAPIPAVTTNTLGQTIDNINVLSVDLTQSAGQLQSASQSDMTNLNTLCYVDGEVMAYQNATLITGFQYNLAPLVRGAYDTNITSHNTGGLFARLDGSIFKFAYTQDFIGQTIYIKFVGFNLYGGGQQSLASVNSYAYTIQGTALTSPLEDVTNLRTSYVAAITQLNWDEVQDFRPIMYEIRQGAAWTGARILGRVAHPPFNVQGNGTYFVGVYSQPTAGLQLYSPTPQSVVVSGAQIVSNVIATWDEGATGWTGAVSGGAGVVSGTVQTVASGNILTDPDFLNTPNILNYGNIASGIYTIPVGHIINIGRVAPCNVIISWTPFGQNVNDNILTVNDFLNFADLVDYASSAAVNIFPEIQLSQDGTTFGPWQKWSPGAYNAMAFNARMQLQITSVQIKAEISSFVFSVDVPDRDDHYTNQAIAGAGTTITFQPDGAASAAAFNGGPNGATTPAIQVTILNASAGDQVVVSGVTLAHCTIQVLNGGVGVARNCNILVEGF